MLLYIVLAVVLAFVFSTLLCILSCMSCLGLTEQVKRLV